MEIGNKSEKINISGIIEFDEYLKKLVHICKDVLILLSVKDTVGLNFREESAELLNKLGIKNNLSNKHGHSYIAVIDRGDVVVDNLSATNEDLDVRINCEDMDIFLRSSVYSRNNVSEIRIEDVDYSIDLRGLNIVVFDLNEKKVADRVCFDTHVRKNVCYRIDEKNEIQNIANARTIFRLQKQVDSLRKEIAGVKDYIAVEAEKMQMLIWQSMNASGERIDDTKRRFFRSMSVATGDLRKVQQACVILLNAFNEICKENGIVYWISFGTLLGAKRHGGFIPWDDDTDVCILKDQLPKLKKALEGNKDFMLDEFYSVRHTPPANMNHNYQIHFTQKNTPYCMDLFICEYSDHVDQKLIDDTRAMKAKMSEESLELSRKMHGNKTVSNKRYNPEFGEIFDRYYEKMKMLYGDSESKEYIVWSMDNLMSKTGCSVFFPRDVIFPLKEMEFEGYSFPVPNKTEYYLEEVFGDYMSLPNDISHKHFNITDERREVLEEVLEKYKHLYRY